MEPCLAFSAHLSPNAATLCMPPALWIFWISNSCRPYLDGSVSEFIQPLTSQMIVKLLGRSLIVHPELLADKVFFCTEQPEVRRTLARRRKTGKISRGRPPDEPPRPVWQSESFRSFHNYWHTVHVQNSHVGADLVAVLVVSILSEYFGHIWHQLKKKVCRLRPGTQQLK